MLPWAGPTRGVCGGTKVEKGQPCKGVDSSFSDPGGKVKRAVKMEVLRVESREINNKVMAVK